MLLRYREEIQAPTQRLLPQRLRASLVWVSMPT